MKYNFRKYNSKKLRSWRRPGNSAGIESACNKYSDEHVKLTLSKLFQSTRRELILVSRNPQTPSFERVIARALLSCLYKGSFKLLDKMLDRCIGKVPQPAREYEPSPAERPLPTPIIVYQPVSSRSECPGI